MGVPRFYRWLSERYPLVNEKLLASVNAAGNTSSENLRVLYPKAPHLYEYLENIQLSSTSSFHVDCLYLDLNGIIHGSTHANSTTGSLMVEHRYEEVWLNIMGYIGRIVEIARPRRLLFIAVDGVAPRAKMNQQRARRFRSAEERKVRCTTKQEPFDVDETVFGASHMPDSYADGLDFDSNCITPGTEFMFQLQRHLDFFVSKQMSENAIWKNIEVILSGPDVPGEGEHKIAEFLRSMRTQDQYPPNLSHCIQGLDADLVMLSLMSHEPLFTLLREEVVLDQEPRWVADQRRLISRTDAFQLLHISLVREYLALDVLSNIVARGGPPRSTKQACRNPLEEVEKDSISLTQGKTLKAFPELLNSKEIQSLLADISFDVERVIDDFILFCCLAGNDFLPHLAFADIGSNGLDKMLTLYIDHLVSFGRRLKKGDSVGNEMQTPWLLEEGGKICWPNLLLFLKACSAELEEEMLSEKVESARWLQSKSHRLPTLPTDPLIDDTIEDSSGADGGPGLDQWYARGRTIQTIEDHVAFHYWRKMQFDIRDGTEASLATRDRLIKSYLEGLQWTMLYYFDGVPSWSWFYPFHYAPFARDIVRYLEERNGDPHIQFDLGKPFHPFQQLMAVLPPLSAQLIPALYRPLMQSGSPIHDFYPKVFGVDREGVKVSWGGVTLLPFIDENRLLAAMADAAQGAGALTKEEDARSLEGALYIYRREKMIKPFVLMTLASGGLITTPEKRSLVSSTLPSYFRDIVDPGVPLRYAMHPSKFTFRQIQRGRHRSAISPKFMLPPWHPSFLNWSNRHLGEADLTGEKVGHGFTIEVPEQPEGTIKDTDQTLHLPSWASSPFERALCQTRRIRSILRQKDIVRAFYRVTKNPSLIISVSPSFLTPERVTPEQLLRHCLTHLSQLTTRIASGIGNQLDFDFSFLPTVRCTFPYRHVGKLIGVWLGDLGYVPLHQKSKGIEVSFQELFLNDMRGPVLRGWKTSKTHFDQIKGNLYNLIVRKGLKFSQEEIIAIDPVTSTMLIDLESQLSAIRSVFSSSEKAVSGPRNNSPRKAFNWKDLVFEVLEIEEVAENLASKPLIRYKQNQSRLCFYSELEFVYDVMTTDQFHQALSTHVANIGDTVMCSAETPFFGNVGNVAECSGYTLLSQFDVRESPEQRYDYQKKIMEAYTEAYKRERWFSINELSKILRRPVRILRFILRKLTVRTVDGSWKDLADMGLGLMQETKSPVDGTMVSVCVPGYSYLDSNNQYRFSEQVVGLLKRFFAIWPQFESSIAKLGESDKVTLSTFFGDKSEISAIDEHRCVTRYLKWLNSQPFKTTGTSFMDYDCIPLASTEKILDAMLKESTTLSSVVPEVYWVKGYQNVLRELHSPVVPVKKIKMLALGQRVVVVKSGSLAVYGTRGIVVALFPGSQEANEGELVAEIICETPVVGGQSFFSRYDSVCRRLRIPCRCLLAIPPFTHFGKLTTSKTNYLEHNALVLRQCVHWPSRKVLETCYQSLS